MNRTIDNVVGFTVLKGNITGHWGNSAVPSKMNQANQRTTNNLADGGKWIYQYNERGEVVSGKKYFSDGQPVQGAQFEYDFEGWLGTGK